MQAANRARRARAKAESCDRFAHRFGRARAHLSYSSRRSGPASPAASVASYRNLQAPRRAAAAQCARSLPLERQLLVARPLVPRACVVARGVAGRAKRECGQPGARARMAVGDDLLRVADKFPDLRGPARLARSGEKL